MKRHSLKLFALLLGVTTLTTSACSPDAASPVAPAPHASLLTSLTSTVGGLVKAILTPVPGVSRNQPLAQDVSVTQSIGPAGGTIALPGAGTTIVFAPGAVTKATAITATANAGSLITYSFAPHGITFKAPVTLTVDVTNTNIAQHPELAPTLGGGYMPNGLLDLDGLGNALISELIPATAQTTGTGTATTVTSASFTIPHFSGYILAGGRSAKGK
jgi:hypothetical protein